MFRASWPGPGPAAAGSSGSKTATTSVSGQLAAVFLALTPGSVTTTMSYDPDDEATVLTDPDSHATLTCYDGDGHVAETVPPVGVAADSLSASSCPTATRATTATAWPPTPRPPPTTPRQQDHGDHAGPRGTFGLRDDDLRL